MVAWPIPPVPNNPHTTPPTGGVLRHRVRTRDLPPARIRLIRALHELIDLLAEHPDLPVDHVEAVHIVRRQPSNTAGRARVAEIADDLGTPLDNGVHARTVKAFYPDVSYQAFYVPKPERGQA